MAKNNNKIVPASKQALDALKYEIAEELGLPVGKNGFNAAFFNDAEFAAELGSFSTAKPREDYWGHIASRDAGAVGGTITKRLIQRAEEVLFSIT